MRAPGGGIDTSRAFSSNKSNTLNTLQDQGVDEKVSMHVPNDSCTEFAKECSPAVSSPGSWVPDVSVPVESIEHAGSVPILKSPA